MVAAVETMVSGMGQTPWHGLGNVVEGAMTAAEATSLGGLDWEVGLKQVAFYDDNFTDYDKQYIEVPNQYAIVRTDVMRPLGVVSDRYHVVQNSEGFKFFDSFVSNKEAMYHTAGVLHGGKKVWILAKLPGEIIVGGNDLTNKFVLIAMSHDGKSSIIIKLTPIRVVCQNTLNAALSGGGDTYHIRHNASVHDQIKEAAEAMGFANKMYGDLGEVYNLMYQKKLNYSDSIGYLERCFGLEDGDQNRNFNETVALLDNGMGSDMARGTLWGAYNAVTERIDHKKYRNNDSRLNSAWFSGPSRAVKDNAFREALELLKV
jgi:phage/plasmid-like protein (TIGR03299 family)